MMLETAVWYSHTGHAIVAATQRHTLVVNFFSAIAAADGVACGSDTSGV